MVSLILIVVLAVTLTGCNSYVAFTFNVENNDQIKVKLDTSNGERLSQKDGIFKISYKDDTPISIGIFQTNEAIDNLFNIVKPSDNITVIEESLESNPQYIFYQTKTDTDKSEWNYIIRFNDTETGIALANETSEESAKKIFELLTFEVNP